MSVQWVVQNNLFNEEAHDKLVAEIEAQGGVHKEIKLIPFDGMNSLIQSIKERDIKPDVPTIFYGSTSLATQLSEYHRSLSPNYPPFVPGLFSEFEDFNLLKLSERYGELMLNEYVPCHVDVDSIRVAWERVGTQYVFIRPIDDSKMFSGTLLEGYELEMFVDTLRCNNPNIDKMRLVLSSPKSILAEYRIFVVDGKIVAGSSYRYKGNLDSRLAIPYTALQTVYDAMKRYTPAPAYAIDIAEMYTGEHRIIELGCINCTGFYNSSVKELVRHLNRLALNSRRWKASGPVLIGQSQRQIA